MGAVLAGLMAGVLSGWGVGGGTLLLVYLTNAAGMEQTAAQGINLLYFLPCALPAAVRYRRQGLMDRQVWRFAVPGGVMGAVAGALLAGLLPVDWLRKAFGILLLITGVRELIGRPGK